MKYVFLLPFPALTLPYRYITSNFLINHEADNEISSADRLSERFTARLLNTSKDGPSDRPHITKQKQTLTRTEQARRPPLNSPHPLHVH